MFSFLKRRASWFLRRHVTEPLIAAQNEIIFQKQFDIQCRNLGITNDFYPVGAAANFGLMYFLLRVLSELEPRKIVEFGSGQSTLLIDRAKPVGARHVCYEHDPTWHARLSSRLTDCEYLLRPLDETVVEGQRVQWYSEIHTESFDLMLVDGPGGADHYSRFGCAAFIKSCTPDDFLIVFDDCDRPGERETVGWITDTFRRDGREFRVNSLAGRKTQAIVSGGRFIEASYFY